MTRRMIKTLVAVMLAVFTLGSIAEAAPRKAVRHRARHSSRVAAHRTVVKKKRNLTGTTTTKKVVKRRNTTKPR